jgi:type 1 glutamine amidotransferase
MALPQVLVLVAKDPPQYERDGKLITAAIADAGIHVEQSTDPAKLATLAGGPFNVVVLYTFGDYLDGEEIQSLATFVRNGGGLVGVHTAIATNPGSDTLGQLFGARIRKGVIAPHEIVVTDPQHPLAEGIQNFHMDDELYVTEQKSPYRAFLATQYEGAMHPMGWTRDEGRGKVAYLGNGHTPGGLSHPTFRELLVRAVRFVAG